MGANLMAKSSLMDHFTIPGERLLSLANEYIAKLNEMVNSVAIFLRDLEHNDHPMYQGARQRRDAEFYKLACVVEMGERILPVTMDLAQAMSQQIEHGSIDGIDKLGIRLKLAELEASIRALERMLADKRVRLHYKSST
jgi:hypothetical protein